MGRAVGGVTRFVRRGTWWRLVRSGATGFKNGTVEAWVGCLERGRVTRNGPDGKAL